MDEPMEQRNEPTTAEIVKALRNCNANDDCMACRELGIDSDCETLELLSAARLEQLERENAELIQSVENAEQLVFDQDIILREKEGYILNLTARAEKAEAELLEYRKRYISETYPTA